MAELLELYQPCHKKKKAPFCESKVKRSLCLKVLSVGMKIRLIKKRLIYTFWFRLEDC